MGNTAPEYFESLLSSIPLGCDIKIISQLAY